MAVPGNTVVSSSRTNKREDLSNVIADISPTETPVLTLIKSGSATARYHEWLTDSLANAALNKHEDGDNDAADASSATVRLGNRTQIMKKTCSVSGSAEAIDKAGYASEMAYQMQKRSKEIKRDCEKSITSNQALVVGAAGTASQMAGIESYLTSNIVYGGTNAGAANPGFNTANGTVVAPTDPNNTGAFTEPKLKALVKSCWDNGGEPDILVAGGFNRQAVSAFSGIASLYRDTAPKLGPASIIASADIYVSDFSGNGGIKVVADRHSRASVALLLDPEYLQMSWLRPFESYELSKQGDSEQRTIIAEGCIQVSNEAAHGKAVGLTTS